MCPFLELLFVFSSDASCSREKGFFSALKFVMVVSSFLPALTGKAWLLSIFVENVESSWSKSYACGLVLEQHLGLMVFWPKRVFGSYKENELQ